MLDAFHLETEALRKVSPEPGQLNGVAQRHDAAYFRIPVDAAEVADRPLKLRQQVAEHGPHGLEHGLRILGGCGVPLQVFRLGKRELQLFRERFGEVVSANRHATLPYAVTVGHNQIGRVGAQRDDNE